MMTDPLSAYRQTRVKTAGQGRLIVMLYDEGLRQIDIAEREMKSSAPRLDAVHNAIVKAQDILTELMVSLDFEKGGDIANNLFNLYMYFNQRLIDANMTKDPSGLREVSLMLADLREAWAAIENQAPAKGDVDEGGGVNLAG
jgi:flagellar protein FliS